MNSTLEAVWYTPESPERDRRVVDLYLAGMTLEEIGKKYGLTRERVRQIVARAQIKRRSPGRRRGGVG